MPGHAGGGHVSGGGFHGGSSFHGGSFSAGRPVVSPAVRIHNTGGQNGSGSGNKGFSPVRLLPLFIIAIFVAVAILTESRSVSRGPVIPLEEENGVWLETEYPAFEKLSPYMCTPYSGNIIDCDISGAFSADGSAKLYESMNRFYEVTGAEPYLMVRSSLDGEITPDYGVVDEFMYDSYISLFGSDEGHILFLLISDGTDQSLWYTEGNYVIAASDELSAGQTVYDLFSDSLWDASYPALAETLSEALYDAAFQIETAKKELWFTEDGFSSLTPSEDGSYKSLVKVRFPVEDAASEVHTAVVIDEKGLFLSSPGTEEKPVSFTKMTGITPVFFITDEYTAEQLSDPAFINPVLEEKSASYGGDNIMFVLVSVQPEDIYTAYCCGENAAAYIDCESWKKFEETVMPAFENAGDTDALFASIDRCGALLYDETYIFSGGDIEYYRSVYSAQNAEDEALERVEGERQAEAGIGYIKNIIFSVICLGLTVISVMSARKKKASDVSPEEKEKRYEKESSRHSSKHDDESYDSHKRESDFGTGYDGLAGEYPVTCPECRATAYLTADGKCQYCGKKLK